MPFTIDIARTKDCWEASVCELPGSRATGETALAALQRAQCRAEEVLARGSEPLSVARRSFLLERLAAAFAVVIEACANSEQGAPGNPEPP
jgi:predicted RNase H-like HicB family nuclease